MDRPTSDFTPIETMMMQQVAFFALRRCAEMGIFDTLEASGPLPPAKLAETHGLRPRRVEALLDMLAADGLLTKTGGAYANTPLTSEHLVASSPFFQGKALDLHVRFNKTIKDNFEGLLRGDAEIRTSTDDGWGTRDNMQGTAQHARMGTLQDTVDFAAELPGFRDMRDMCDIGGNHGEFSMALLDRNPDLRGEIADLPHVADAARKRIEQRGYARRLRAVARDLRTDDPPREAYDLVLASHVLYAFMDSMPGLLASIRASLRPGGWFVSQHLNPEGEQPLRYTSVVEFITRMAGYGTHHIDGNWLIGLLRDAGFEDIRTGSAAKGGLIIAAGSR